MNLRQEAARDATTQVSPVPVRLRIAGLVLRAMFIAALLVVTVRVSSPQSETIWSAYETPGDLIRLALGLLVCVWVVFQMFMPPKDPEEDRAWLYLGVIAVPFGIICAIAVW
jgi:hypothetical protein